MSVDTPRIAPGTLVFDRFEVRSQVARGGFAVVWKAHDRLLGKDVALKVLHTSFADDPAAIQEMKLETLRSRDLTHPHIVQTYDFVVDGPIIAIAMEFIDGETMSTLAAARPSGCFNPADIAAWMGDLCDALAYAHSALGNKKPVVHHDLKPSNFIVDRFGTAKVLDFGISKGTSETRFQHTGQFTVAGTPPYMSPQQLRGQRPSPSDDIYSFGATCYALLTRKPPFYRGDIPTQVLHEIPPTMDHRRAELGVEEPPLPMDWEATIASCLAKEPELRPTTMSEVAVSLGLREPSTRRRAVPTLPGAASSDGTSRRGSTTRRDVSTKTVRPRRGKKAAVGGLAAAGIVGAAILLRPRDETSSTETAAALSVDPVPTAVQADLGVPPVASSTSNPERDWAEREAEILRREQVLRIDVRRAMNEGKWEQAQIGLDELVQISPKDAEVSTWTAAVENELAVRDLVEAYRVAQESRDADAYGMLWEDLSVDEMDALRASYLEIRTLTLGVDQLDIRVDGDTARVRMHESISLELRGVGKQTTDARTLLTLKKTAAGWKIAGRETE